MAFDEEKIQTQPQQQPIIGYPTYQQQQLYQQLQPQQQQPMYQQPIAQMQQQQQPTQIINNQMIPMSKIKIRHNTNCVGNYTTYQINYPQSLMGIMSAQEYQDLIVQFNKIVYFNRMPIIIVVILQLLFTIPIVICSINNNFPVLIAFVAIVLFLSVLTITLSLYLTRKASRNMEKKIEQVNLQYAPRRIHFEMKTKYISSSGKKFHIKLSLHFPTVGFYLQPQPIQQQMYYNNNNAILQQQQPIVYQSQTSQQLNNNNNNNEQAPLLL